MGKLHKEIGQLIVQSAEDPEKSDSQVIQVTFDLPYETLQQVHDSQGIAAEEVSVDRPAGISVCSGQDGGGWVWGMSLQGLVLRLTDPRGENFNH